MFMNISVIINHKYVINCSDRWINVTSASSSILSILFIFSSHVLSNTSAEFWWHDIYSLLLLSSVISLLVILPDCVWFSICKIFSLFNEIFIWMLTRGRFEFSLTSSLFELFKLCVSLLLKCELTSIYLLFLDLNETFLPYFFLD